GQQTGALADGVEDLQRGEAGASQHLPARIDLNRAAQAGLRGGKIQKSAGAWLQGQGCLLERAAADVTKREYDFARSRHDRSIAIRVETGVFQGCQTNQPEVRFSPKTSANCNRSNKNHSK